MLVCAFAALSSSAAAALGLEEERILAFTGLLGLLLLLPFLVRPRLPGRAARSLSCWRWLTGIMLADLAGRFDPLDAKLALPVLVLLAAPNLARFLPAEALTRSSGGCCPSYVAATFAYQLVAEPAAVARGYEGIVRYDPTGSVVMHSSLSLIHLLVAVARLGRAAGAGARLATLALGGMSLSMVLLTATRTALVTLVIFAPLQLATARRPASPCAGWPSAGVGFAARLRRLDAPGQRQLLAAPRRRRRATSAPGAGSSIGHWLALAGDHPLGPGAGRGARAAGRRPAGAGRDDLLEWPHNESVRFYVEAGPPGLLFVVLLLALLVRRALRAARGEVDPVRRALMLAIAADLVAEACLQNLLNAIYHATVLILILSLAVAATRRPVARDARRADGTRPRGRRP